MDARAVFPETQKQYRCIKNTLSEIFLLHNGKFIYSPSTTYPEEPQDVFKNTCCRFYAVNHRRYMYGKSNCKFNYF